MAIGLGFRNATALHSHLSAQGFAVSLRNVQRYWNDPNRYPTETFAAIIYQGLGWKLSDWIDENALELSNE